MFVPPTKEQRKFAQFQNHLQSAGWYKKTPEQNVVMILREAEDSVQIAREEV